MPLHERIFPSKTERAFFSWYRKVFSLHELEQSLSLQLAFGVLLLYLFNRFADWVTNAAGTVESYTANAHACWPYFQSCGEWYFLHAMPHGYSQSTLYMVFFGAMVLIAYLMYRRDWTLAHILFLPLWVWTALLLFVLTHNLQGNYDYYFMVVSFAVLFLPHKLFFARLAFVTLYFLSSTIKFHEGWVLGTYFTSLQTGLPVIGNTLAPLATNIVILSQVVGCWFLLSNLLWVRRTAAAFFIFFHLYSGILVEYLYPSIALLLSIALFTIGTERTQPAHDRRALAGWVFIAVLFALQSISILIPGDVKLTLEGNQYGLYMFEANHQCISKRIIHRDDGTTDERTRVSILARNRCDPYRYWFSLKEICRRNTSIEKISWTFDHSINGGAFYRIVDVEDACALSYNAFGRNDWIQLPSEGARVVGYPVRNIFY